LIHLSIAPADEDSSAARVSELKTIQTLLTKPNWETSAFFG